MLCSGFNELAADPAASHVTIKHSFYFLKILAPLLLLDKRALTVAAYATFLNVRFTSELRCLKYSHVQKSMTRQNPYGPSVDITLYAAR